MSRGSPRKEIKKTLWANMVRMTPNGLIGTTKGKSKVNGSWKPKKRGKKSNGPTWQE